MSLEICSNLKIKSQKYKNQILGQNVDMEVTSKKVISHKRSFVESEVKINFEASKQT